MPQWIVPFVVRPALPSRSALTVRPILLFLANRGRELCDCSECSAEEWLEENGFVFDKVWVEADIYFAKIDAAATGLRKFYSYEQLTAENGPGTEECWRTFYMMDDPAWLDTIDEKFRPLLASILKTGEVV